MQEIKEYIDISIDLSKIHSNTESLKINEYVCKFMNIIIRTFPKSTIFAQYTHNQWIGTLREIKAHNNIISSVPCHFIVMKTFKIPI